MTTTEHFRISTHLKDIIGRELVTNEFVAVFELVKNAFDAQAKQVQLGFNLDDKIVWIVDDGKGMNADAIRDRWLFVAYSAKADGSEDYELPTDYRDHIRPSGQYAGSKGIGRFSCDTLGEELTLYSRPPGTSRTQKLEVNWKDFEENSKEVFQQIDVQLEEVKDFPVDASVSMPKGSGTVIQIRKLRSTWEFDQILRLRQYLEKLIDPFGTTQYTPVTVLVTSSDLTQDKLDELEGPIGNDLRDLLSEKTTRIVTLIEDQNIRTELVDRSRRIYQISEKNEYKGLKNSTVRAEVFYLNQSAKNTFTRRMGVRPVTFGSIFLFLNGFRVFPVGEETDDTFGLNRRKQQGSARYFGTRDVMGRIDIDAPPGVFREASSRDAGLIEDAHARDLYEAIRNKAIIRLERYVVGVTWKDKADQLREDASALSFGETRGRVAQLIGQLAASNSVELEYYDSEIVELFDEDARSLEGAMKSLVAIAETQGDSKLLERVEKARRRQRELEESEREAAEAAHRALAEKALADQRIARLEQQAKYLATTQDMTAEQMTLLLHQVLIYAGHIGAAVDRALNNARNVTDAANDIESDVEDGDIVDAAAAIRVYTGQVVDDIEYIHLENDRLMAVARFASNARFDLETDYLEGDVVAFLEEYVNKVRASREGVGTILLTSHDLSQLARFRPVDMVVVVDNLMDNARKHDARQMKMIARRGQGGRGVEIVVTDDGHGIDESRVDSAHIFDKGYTSTPGGTGLGLYHARKVMQEMGGGLQLDPEREDGRATFIITLPRKTQ